ncbi:hypothetical protein C3941_14495 [Kaistia algarum]|uniref:FxLYD domain-containing protein n=1 Tax=Kaistia algarum TaxID=2083279 RepID=UPI000CE81FFD|nr:FxLYD domain-containing protein [Kaistia algarum]MCX5514281.1 DUF3426 domain-containing protein [Kaistia algarum]PPE79038.1 hypothetical protein C3941_14495 [Kaistia algarum]
MAGAVPARGAGIGRRDWRDSASLVLLVLLVLGFVVLRTPIVAAAPGLASLYTRLGLPVNLRGLEFRNVATMRDNVSGAPGLVVTGEILAQAGGNRGLPALAFTLYDDRGREVGGWSAPIDHRPLAAGETASFRSRLADPPDSAKTVKLRFEGAAEGKS